jgi:microcystin-dependent protein
MDNRKWQAAASATPPADEASPSSGYPTDGNPSTPTPATIPGARWFHQVGEEIRAVIAAAGLTPDSTVLTQLRDAIQAMIVGAQKAVIVNGVTFEASVADGEAVRWDSGNSRFDEAIADGTANNRAVGIADVTNSRVYLYGECPLFSGLTPGSRYYLDASTAGAITATAPTDRIAIGIAKSATTLWVDVDADPAQTGVEVGSIVYVPANAAPTGYIKANGALVSRTTYAALWAYAQASGNLAASDGAWVAGKFSPGDGSTTFRIPDLRAEFIRGWDDGRGVDSGRAIGTAQADDLKAHTHTGGVSGSAGYTAGAASSAFVTPTVATGSTGGTETRPRNIALLGCIKY